MIALLPWGAYEQHGPLLPPNTDTTIAEFVAKKVAENLRDCMVFDSIPYGVSVEHDGFENTVSLSYQAAICMLESMLRSISQNHSDIQLLVIINGHGGNQDVASMVCRELNYTTSGTRFETFHVFQPASRRLAAELFGTFSAHADSVETSVWGSITGRIDDGSRCMQSYGCSMSLPHAMKLYPVKKISKGGIVSKTEDLIINREYGKRVIDKSIEVISEQINEYISVIKKMDSRTN